MNEISLLAISFFISNVPPMPVTPIPEPVPVEEIDVVAREIGCLADNIIFEARGEGLKGMQAVAHVTMNRVRSWRFPDTVCDVVYDPKQFSWTHEPEQELKSSEKKVLNAARSIAKSVYIGEMKDNTKGSTHYHSKRILPFWAVKYKRVATIGNHHFYQLTR